MLTDPLRALLVAVVPAVCTSLTIASDEQPQAESPPNVVLILSDDQAWTDYGFMGHPHIQTPNLDRLAGESVIFRRGYVPTALCRPALLTLATGHYAHRHGLTGNSPSKKYATPGGKLYTERLATLVSYIKRFDTLPALLAERGYLSHQSGKWWEGSYSHGGFTHGMTRGFPNPGNYHGFCRIGDDGLKIGREGMKPVEQFVDMATQKRKPFFLWYAPYMPHVPHTPPKRLLTKYTDAGLTRPTASYYAMCEWFDETCGQLIDYLEKKGVRGNTLIVYVTDNGWVQNPNSGGHLTRSKASPYEGGIRTPIMFSWPGRLGPADREEVVSSIDVMPTILAAAGARVPAGLPGLNLLPHLKAGTPIEREMIFGENFAHNIADIEDPEASLTFRWCIAGEWKLLLTYDGEVVHTAKEWDSRTVKCPQLFNLADDPHEKQNVAAAHPQVVARLAKAISDWYPVTKRKTQEVVQGEKVAARGLVEKALHAMDGAEEIVFAVRGLYTDGHYYANFGHWSSDPNKMMYADGGSNLCKLNLRTGQVTVLLDDPQGGFRDPRVHYDGGKLLFSYRKGGTKYHHLYEIDPDGTGLKQLTFGPWDDVEPAYLPDGGITFVSSRCDRFVPCYHTQTGLLYRMDADGGNLRLLSANNVGDHRPAMLPNGRVLYTRWEYVDRAPQKFHTLWTMNPDGTDQMILYGNMLPPSGYNIVPRQPYVVMIDALPIPGTTNVVAVFSPGHGNRENAGNVMIVDPDAGPDDPAGARQISPVVKMSGGWAGGRGGFRDPYPLSRNCFLVARNKSLLILDDQGRTEEVYQAEEMLHDPRVIRPRRREHVVPSHSDPKKPTGRLVLANVYQGRNMQGVEPGEIKKLLVMEDLPKPVSYYSLPGAIGMDGTHTLHRILGTVPVEPDGSAYLEVPPLRGLFFAALDEQGMAVKRMQSYLTVMPGETLGCVGCHENRTETTRLHGNLMATARGPSRIEPIPGVPEVIDYRRDVQPILDEHCVECHNADKPEGRVVLTGDYNEWFSQSYFALFAGKQISDSWRYDEDGNHAPRGFGSAASALMNKIDGSHYEVKPSAVQRSLLQLWIDAGATYAGTYAAFNHAEVAVAGALANSPKVAIGGTVGRIVESRCLGCHGTVASLGRRAEKGRVNLPKHCWNLYNLSHPERSMILLAPLAEEAGGYGWCKTKSADGQPGRPARVFQDTGDSDYQSILGAIRAAKDRREKAAPFDMPSFRPNEHYVRWMKEFGVLPDDFYPNSASVDVYELDQTYWQSLWYRADPAKYTKRQQMALAGRSSWLDGTAGNHPGVCTDLRVKNPSFEAPEVRRHPWFRPASGDVPQIAPYDWQASRWDNTMKYSQGRCSLAPFEPYDGKKKDAALAAYGPAATDGKQVAKMWLGRSGPHIGEDVKHAWLFQSLGTVTPADVGGTLELAVDVAAREHYPQTCGAGPKAGGSATAAFARGVSPLEAGREVGQPGRIDKLLRDGDTKTLRARLKIDPGLVGQELVVRLSIADPEPSPGYGCHYHFDNVRCAMSGQQDAVKLEPAAANVCQTRLSSPSAGEANSSTHAGISRK